MKRYYDDYRAHLFCRQKSQETHCQYDADKLTRPVRHLFCQMGYRCSA